MSSEKCSQCNRIFTFPEAEIRPLSPREEVMCMVEGLDPAYMMKVTCPNCNTASLIPIPEDIDDLTKDYLTKPRLVIGGIKKGKKYPIVKSSAGLGHLAKLSRPCILETSFNKISEDWRRSFKESEGNIRYEEHMLITCTRCGVCVSTHDLGTLIMLDMFDSVTTVTSSTARQKELDALYAGQCPNCGEKSCYYIYDPKGFSWLDIEGQRKGPYLYRQKNKKWWRFWEKG